MFATITQRNVVPTYAIAVLACGFVWLLAAPFTFGGNNDPAVSQELRAHRFSLIGEGGKDIAEFSVREDGSPAITLWDKDRLASVSLSVEGNEMPHVALQNRDGNSLVDIGILDDKLPVVVLRDANGKRRIAMSSSRSGEVSMLLYDGEQRERCKVGVTAKGEPNIVLRDTKRNSRADLVLVENGLCRFTLADANGKDRVVFQVDAEEHADGAVFGADGRAVWSTGQSKP